MTYIVSVQNAKTGWVIETCKTPDLASALRKKTEWFREFHGPVDYDAFDQLRPEKIHLPVFVNIASA